MLKPIISRGTWHNHIYVNESMGFQFELPETWFIYADEEKAEFIDLMENTLFNYLDVTSSVDMLSSVEDMRAEDFFYW